MTLQEACLAAAADLRAAAPRLVQTEAQTILALSTLRVQDIGLVGKLYSNRDSPLFWFKDRALNAGGRSWLEAKKKRTKPQRKADPATWAGFRAAQGLPMAAVNLTYSGRMFRSLTTLYTGLIGNVYTANIVASDSESAKVVAYNVKRYGNFLAPTPSEATEATAATNQEVVRILGAYFKMN